MADTATQTAGQPDQPWQLLMFDHSLKEQRKLQALKALLPPLLDKRCLLVSSEGNSGALNWHLRTLGGDWEWGAVATENLEAMADFLGDPVLRIPEDNAPFPDGVFDCILAIDVLDRLEDDQAFLKEMRRLLHGDGLLIVTAPNGDQALLARRIKSALNRSPALFGQRRAGYTTAELALALRKVQLAPGTSGGYSRFFTEMLDLLLSPGYGRLISRARTEPGAVETSPVSAGQIKTNGTSFRLYSLLFPVARLLSRLDGLLPERSNNEVIVTARKGAAE